MIVCDGNAFEATFFEFAPKTRSVHSFKTKLIGYNTEVSRVNRITLQCLTF